MKRAPGRTGDLRRGAAGGPRASLPLPRAKTRKGRAMANGEGHTSHNLVAWASRRGRPRADSCGRACAADRDLVCTSSQISTLGCIPRRPAKSSEASHCGFVRGSRRSKQVGVLHKSAGTRMARHGRLWTAQAVPRSHLTHGPPPPTWERDQGPHSDVFHTAREPSVRRLLAAASRGTCRPRSWSETVVEVSQDKSRSWQTRWARPSALGAARGAGFATSAALADDGWPTSAHLRCRPPRCAPTSHVAKPTTCDI